MFPSMFSFPHCVSSAVKPEELQASLSRIAELEAELEQKQVLLEVWLATLATPPSFHTALAHWSLCVCVQAYEERDNVVPDQGMQQQIEQLLHENDTLLLLLVRRSIPPSLQSLDPTLSRRRSQFPLFQHLVIFPTLNIQMKTEFHGVVDGVCY